MTLDEALARIQELETKLDALEAEPEGDEGGADTDADGDGQKCPKCGAMNSADATECSECGAALGGAKMDAADFARLEGERDAARTSLEEAKTAHAAELAQVRKDAEESAAKSVRESMDVLTKAVMVLKAPKIKLDGKDVDLVDAPLRAVKCAVIKHLKGKVVPASKLDTYVDALFEDAIESFDPAAKSLAAAKAVVEDNSRQDAAPVAPPKDPEAAANELLKNRYASAWMASDKSEDK